MNFSDLDFQVMFSVFQGCVSLSFSILIIKTVDLKAGYAPDNISDTYLITFKWLFFRLADCTLFLEHNVGLVDAKLHPLISDYHSSIQKSYPKQGKEVSVNSTLSVYEVFYLSAPQQSKTNTQVHSSSAQFPD